MKWPLLLYRTFLSPQEFPSASYKSIIPLPPNQHLDFCLHILVLSTLSFILMELHSMLRALWWDSCNMGSFFFSFLLGNTCLCDHMITLLLMLYLCSQFLYIMCFEDCCGLSRKRLDEHLCVFLSAVKCLNHKTGRKLPLTWSLFKKVECLILTSIVLKIGKRHNYYDFKT